MKLSELPKEFVREGVQVVYADKHGRINSVDRYIEIIWYGEKDEDCVILESKCPFGCYVAVHSEKEKEISQIIENFPSNCSYKCMPVFDLKCEEAKCKIKFGYED